MKQELLKFCYEKGLLLDSDILELFDDIEDVDSVKLIIEKIKEYTHQNVITKNILEKNKDKVSNFLVNFPGDKEETVQKIKVKLGLNIEISAENIPSDSEVYEEPVVKIPEETKLENKKIEVKDFVKYFKNRFEVMRDILQEHSELDNVLSISKISNNIQGISIIGIVTSKTMTKNRNMILELEDFTGKIKVLINNNRKELFEKAQDITLDSVLGFKGSGNREIFFVNDVIFPEAMLSKRKRSNTDEIVLFIGDLHFGSKRFLRKGFDKFIDYLKNKGSKINYLFLVGDIVTGVGNYPNQEDDLKIKDLEEQFQGLANLLKEIPEHIKLIISPGNHDGVRLMEPQPVFNEKYAWPIYDLENAVVTENPAYVNIGSKTDFSGFDVLIYHGFSYPYYANNISSLIKKDAMNCPEEIIKYLLKNRHLAPTHGSTQYFPLEEDPLIIKKIPDILVSAHTHKCGITYYNNILIVSTSCWEAMTPYQEKFGNDPDHCKVPMMNLKNRQVKILDFEVPEESEGKGGKNE